MSSGKPQQTPLPPAGWVVLCALLNCAGWALSLVHQLNLLGYSVVVAGALLVVTAWWKRAGRLNLAAFKWRTLARRFRRGFALGFLILAALAFLGGATHSPNNYDGLAYRIPRVLNWLSEGRWHWIHTGFQRLNVRAVGYEWVTAPVLLLTRSDRFLFLINTVSFLLLPGLVFSVFTRLGIRPRAAWYWMWLLPSGYGFLLQAGSIGNDLFGAVFGLAALDFALRARTSGKIQDLWISCLAAALVSASKTSNLPLLLPWFVAFLPSVPLLKRKLPATVAVAMAAAASSFLPMAVVNVRHGGGWTGQALEQAQFLKGRPVSYLTQNTLLLAIHNLVPPVFPMAGAWNHWVRKLIPAERQARLDLIFEPVGAHLAVGEMQMEEDAGLGFGVSLMLLATAAGTLFSRRGAGRVPLPARRRWYEAAVRLAACISVLPYMAVSGASTPARLVLPYYGLIVPVLLIRQTGDWIKRNVWWQRMALLVMLVAAGLLIISPARPLWPAHFVFSKLSAGEHSLINRARTVYSVYAERPEAFAPARDRLPADADVLGLISADDPETSLWKPFFRRRILHVLPGESATEIASRGIKYVLVSRENLALRSKETVEQWAAHRKADILWTVPLVLRASRGPVDWTLVKLP